MAEIKIKFQDLEGNLTKLEEQINALDVFRKLCINTVSIFGESWTGEASSAYVDKIQGYAKEMKELQNKLLDTKRRLEEVKELLEYTDNACANMISGI